METVVITFLFCATDNIHRKCIFYANVLLPHSSQIICGFRFKTFRKGARRNFGLMDITAFFEDDFDTKSWVNQVLEQGDQGKRENYTLSLVMKLQLYVQQINNALEETSADVFQSIPKIMRNTKQLQEEAAALRVKMSEVHQEIVQIENETGISINTIEKLDNLMSSLEISKQRLQESDNWTILVNDLEDLFDSKNVEQISKKIQSMQLSLKLLANESDYEDRKMQLEGLKNRLEAIASPLIVQAFSSKNSSQAKTYVEIFTSIDRLQQLIKYYHKCHRENLLNKWHSLLEKDQDESVVQLIHNFYDTLISNWHNQIKWLNQVFTQNNNVDVLIEVYADVLNSVNPNLKHCIDAALKQSNEKLSLLFDVKGTMLQFCKNLSSVIKGQSRVETSNALFAAVFSPFVEYVGNFGTYLQVFLQRKLSEVNCPQTEVSDTVQRLGLSLNTIIEIANSAKNHCSKITENCGYCGLISGLRGFFIEFIEQFRSALRTIELGKKSEDWSTFQQCLALLQNAGDLTLKIKDFEKSLTETVLIGCSQKFENCDFKYLLLAEKDRKEFESLVKCVTEGIKLSLLDHVNVELLRLCSDIHSTTYQVVLSPIITQLNVVASIKTWEQFKNSSFHSADLPEYSLTPQEYITEIGQYLMTLPQHLEPFFFRENPSLIFALKSSDSEYATEENEGELLTVFLKLVAKGTCQSYIDKILSICELDNAASRQLSHDIGYLGNVLQDLGLSLSENLQRLADLLRIPADQYQAQSSGQLARYVAAVRQMRNIPSN